MMIRLLCLLLLSLASLACRCEPLRQGWAEVDGVHLFFREGGDPAAPAVVFLHGNPLSSAMYARVMEDLAGHVQVHVIALDYPSFGFSDAPDRARFAYTFDHLATLVEHFLAQRGIERYSLYMQDYGVPIGFRLLVAHPQAVQAIVVQNGVIHLDGFPSAQDAQGELRRHWERRDPQVDRRRSAYIAALPYPQAQGWEDEDHVGPDVTLEMIAAAQRPGVPAARADLWFDYGSNVRSYPAWQAALRRFGKPVLVLWGTRDAFFTPPGALAYLREAPQAEVHLLDSTHFATLDAPLRISPLLGEFLVSHGLAKGS